MNETTNDEQRPEGSESGAQAEATPAPTTDQRLGALEAELAEARVDAEQARAEAKARLDELLRTRAEMENMRKRAQRDVENAHKYGLEKLIDEFFPVTESLEGGARAAAEGADPEKVREGLELTLKLLAAALEKCGVQYLDPVGEKFNPELHEAIGAEPAADATPGTVLKVVRKGYRLNDRLVRAPLVVVAR